MNALARQYLFYPELSACRLVTLMLFYFQGWSMPKYFALLVFFGLLATHSSQANVALRGQVNHETHSLQKNVTRQLNGVVSRAVPGVVLHVSTPHTEFSASAGIGDLKTGEPMHSKAVIPIGSAGKKYLAALASMLHEQGTLNLDAPLVTYVPHAILQQFSHTQKTTLRHLLSHTSGLFNYVDNQQFFYDAFARAGQTRTDKTALQYARGEPLQFSPGENYRYSNTGYAAAGLVIQAMIEQPLCKVMHERLSVPMALESTFFLDCNAPSRRLSPGYLLLDEDDPIGLAGEQIETSEVYANTAISDAPVFSNAREMSRFLRALISGKGWPEDGAREVLLAPDVWRHIGRGEYFDGELYAGMGLFRETHGDYTLYHHGGTELGYMAQHIYVTDLDISLTALFNCGAVESCERPAARLTRDMLQALIESGETHQRQEAGEDPSSPAG